MMRIVFHAEPIGDLGAMSRPASQLMINTSAALLQADLALAKLRTNCCAQRCGEYRRRPTKPVPCCRIPAL
ncbi:MAG: hypothetical protein ACRDTG_01595 [Pseudonocardiaceae bacterium]